MDLAQMSAWKILNIRYNNSRKHTDAIDLRSVCRVVIRDDVGKNHMYGRPGDSTVPWDHTDNGHNVAQLQVKGFQHLEFEQYRKSHDVFSLYEYVSLVS